VLRAEARAFGLRDGKFAIFDQADQAGVVPEILRTVRGGDRRFDVWAILSRISKARNEFVAPEAFEGRDRATVPALSAQRRCGTKGSSARPGPARARLRSCPRRG